MLDLNDPKWEGLEGGYRFPFDPRPMLDKLKASPVDGALWNELFEELYHQGDVGEASYAAVPEIARLIIHGHATSWHSISAVLAIELARTSTKNPTVPEWLKMSYFGAIDDLARYCLDNLRGTVEVLEITVMLSFLTLWKGLRVHARAFEYSESDLIYYFDER